MSNPKDSQNANIIPGTNQLLKDYIEAKSNNNNDDYQETSQQLRERMIEILSKAIKQLYTNDIKLFKLNKEETLSSRIAHYIECQIREGDYCGYYADVEYSIVDKKKRFDKGVKNYADIFVNSRRYYSNFADILLAIEVKCKNEEKKTKKDIERLKELIKKDGLENEIHGTLMGIFLLFKEEKATADLYYYKSIEDNAPIMTMQITYKKENLYYPQIGDEREYTKTTSSNNKRQKQHSTKRTANNR